MSEEENLNSNFLLFTGVYFRLCFFGGMHLIIVCTTTLGMKCRKCKRANFAVYSTLVSGIICQLCVAASVVKEITKQLVIVEYQDKTTSRGLLLRPSRRQSENEKRGEDKEGNATLVGVEARHSSVELSVAYEETQGLARMVPDMCEHIDQFVKRTDAFCKAANISCAMDDDLHETPAWDHRRSDKASVGTERLLKVKYFVRMYNDSCGLCSEDVRHVYHVFIYLGLK